MIRRYLLAVTLAAGSLGAQNEGKATFMGYMQSAMDPYSFSNDSGVQGFLQGHYESMVAWSPFFDGRTGLYQNTSFYQNLYAIYPDSWERWNHPEWIAHDQWGNWLYIPFECYSGTCTQYAGDISNPAFRAHWIANAQTVMSRGGYKGIYIDDTNMDFRVSDGWYTQKAPMDSATGQPMTYDAWRGYVASFLEQIRASFPHNEISQNTIWYANGLNDSDSAVKRQLSSASHVVLERGIANDAGLTGGTWIWSVFAYFNYIDRVHALGPGVTFIEYTNDRAALEYGLAGYFLISNGKDKISDQSSVPGNWFAGYDVDLGRAQGPRTYSNGVFQRSFVGGMVLLGEPGMSPQLVNLPGSFQNLDGAWVTSVWLSQRQGVVLRGVVAPPPPRKKRRGAVWGT